MIEIHDRSCQDPGKGFQVHRELIGREGEVAAVRAFLNEPADSSALLTEGEAGIGKTTVWQAGVAEARERGFEVLLAAPAEAESALSLSGVADLLEPA